MTRFAELIEGYRRFRNGGWQEQRERWEQLAERQSPKVMVNVAALVPPFETTPGRHGVSAALEFAVQFLKVEEIVVMGHGLCGGCHAALHRSMEGAEPGRGGFIADWIAMLDDASSEVRAEYPDFANRDAGRAMEMAAVRVSIANLRTFPCIQEKEKRGTLKLRGAFFAIADGMLHVMDDDTGEFSPA